MPEPTEPTMPLTITLELEHRGAELWGKLTFASSEPYKVEQYNVDAVGAGYFFVLRGDEKLPYVGPQRKVDGEAEVELSPDEPVKREVRLDDRYPFAAGKHSYTIQYAALHFCPPDYEEMVPLRSNVVEVEHGADEPTTD